MKISFEREKFSKAFQTVAAVAARRDLKPILQNVKITVDKKTGVLLQATDTEIGIRLRLDECDVLEKGEAILPTNLLKQILTESTEETLSMESSDSKTTVSGYSAKYALDTQLPDEFPDLEEFGEESYHTIPSNILKEMIRRTVFSAESDSGNYSLGGVHFEMDDKEVAAVATDGRRLAWQAGSGESVGGHKVEGVTLPTKAMQLLERALGDDEEPVKVSFSGNRAIFQYSNIVLFSRLVEGRFPKWRKILPADRDTDCLNLLAGAWYVAVKQAQITTNEREPGVIFTFGDGKLILRGNGREVGESEVELPIAYSGQTHEFKMNPKFLADALRILDANTNLIVYPPIDSDPLVIKTEDNFTYIAMPMNN
jgi:DNA polymerase-3 subunit beta